MSYPMLPLVEGDIAAVLGGSATYALLCAEALNGLRAIPDRSIHFGLMDPPYAIGSREPTAEEIVAYLQGASLDTRGDFMGMDWELPPIALWREVYRVLKPGAFLAVYGGTQTDDLLSVGIRAAGFERRDAIEVFGTSRLAWLQAQGMAKGLNISKAIDEAAGRERKVVGAVVYADGTIGHWATSHHYSQNDSTLAKQMEQAPKVESLPATPEATTFDGFHTNVAPKHEVILLFAKPLDAVPCEQIRAVTGWDHWHVVHELSKPAKRAKAEATHNITIGTWTDGNGIERPREARILMRRPLHARAPGGGWSEVQARSGDGEWETLVAYGHAPFKPWSSRTVVANVLVHGTGGLNIDACRVNSGPAGEDMEGSHQRGRFAPNVLLSHCEECDHVGVRRLRATSDVGFSSTDPNWRYGDNRQPFVPHGNEDGTETVDAYRCLAGCRSCLSTWIAESGGEAPTCRCGAPSEWVCTTAHLDEQAGERPSGARHGSWNRSENNLYGSKPKKNGIAPADTGCASRFFPVLHPFKFVPKASPAERHAGLADGEKNDHVAVKPSENVRWVARLIGGHPGAIGLTTFAGCGSEVGAMVAEGYRAIGIERVRKHVDTAQKRVPAIAQMKPRKLRPRAPSTGSSSHPAVPPPSRKAAAKNQRPTQTKLIGID